jgi:hypothetical protein
MRHTCKVALTALHTDARESEPAERVNPHRSVSRTRSPSWAAMTEGGLWATKGDGRVGSKKVGVAHRTKQVGLF